MSIKILTLLATLCVSPALCRAQETRPSDVFDQVRTQYQSMKTYSAEGTIVSDVTTRAITTNIRTTFSLKLKKPNLYIITWNQTTTGMPFSSGGTVWNDGSGPCLYMSVMKTYARIQGDQMALSAATGISSGAASTIPFLFFAWNNGSEPFSFLEDPQIEGSEPIDGDDCPLAFHFVPFGHICR